MALPPDALHENIYAFALAKHQVELFCNQCLTNMVELKKCSACRKVAYCSAECQRADWKLHKRECKAIQAHGEVAIDSIRLVMRIVGLLNQNEVGQFSEEYIPGGIRSFLTLMDHGNHLNAEAEDFAEQYLNFALPPHSHPETIKSIFKKVSVNSFSLSNSTGNSIGIALCVKLSAANHSCKPSTRVCYRGRTAMLVPVDDRLPTSLEGACHSYIDELQTLSTRQATLKKKYKFDCACEGCTDDERNGRMEAWACEICKTGWIRNVEGASCNPCGYVLTRDQYELCRTAEEAAIASRPKLENDSIPLETRRHLCEKLLELFQDTLHAYNVHRIPVLRCLFVATLAIRDIDATAKTGVSLLSIMLEYQSENDPAILFQKYQLSHIFCAGGAHSQAAKFLNDIKGPLERIYTTDASIVRSVYCMILKTRHPS
ncbi:hypothetical protein GCK72_005460 [Caenorhabditis remanei]|uniref:CRE-SET-14 protein n=1 Tax=Caenorhabditis remanei TaxID=31234 RepID=E3LFJ5_CAERE|nr:hypothetical protein GCK72_005460 [Caenorhabditis remanei]EFO86016.1 CRE-SET-14 protein [Caenorhabditis remanei]KAF1765508.1 hypothetical protein GCK72_005460 [Caenorhabditis remanei]